MRRPPLRKLLPWALLCVPLVFVARAATDYDAVPSTQDVPAAPQSVQTNAASDAVHSAQQAAVSARTLLRLTTTLGSHSDQDDVERRLLHAYAEIAAGHLDAARTQAEQLVRDAPHFSLAQLLLGDVMQASRGDTRGFAAAPLPASQQEERKQDARILELRAEALARLAAYTAAPPAGAIPANLVSLAPDVQRAIVVDTARSRVYLFHLHEGIPELQASYYFSQGKLGAGKTRVGDMKTPLGIYFITRKIGAKDLKPLYGAGALTLNYPNEWDKQQGHTGFGVWLHGTPHDSYDRVPLASDGCVVLSNPDVRNLMADTPAGSTPVVITRHVQWLTAPQWAAQRQSVNTKLQADITRAALQGVRPQDALLATSAAPHAPRQPTPVTPGALTILQYPGQIVVQYSAADSPGSTLYRQYWAQRSAHWQLIFQGSVS